MNQLVRFGLILGAICLIATLVLAVTYEVTRPKIEAELKREEEAALKEIIADADSFEAKSAGGIDYFEAKKGDSIVGYCIKTTANGYNGFLRMIVGITPDGIIKGVRVLEHQETPGLGARINEVRPGEKEPWFLKQFVGKPGRTVTAKKDVDAITGATISSKAVSDAVNKSVAEFLEKIKR
jgi:electron transport complex protein RnfG